MDFFGIGPGEILLIIIVALIVFGPEKLVDIGKTLGKTVHSFRTAASDLTNRVTKEIEETKTATMHHSGDKVATALPLSKEAPGEENGDISGR